jgi:hypothetical protein
MDGADTALESGGEEPEPNPIPAEAQYIFFHNLLPQNPTKTSYFYNLAPSNFEPGLLFSFFANMFKNLRVKKDRRFANKILVFQCHYNK